MTVSLQRLSTLLLLLFCANGYALPPNVADDQVEPVLVIGATLHIGNGEVIKNGVIAFADGQITLVARQAPADFQGQTIDGSGKHVYPGLIALASTLGLSEIGNQAATVDTTEIGSINASVRALPAFNTDSEFLPVSRHNGVLLAQVMPQGGLVSGVSSIVALDARTWQQAAVGVDGGLHINWPGRKIAKFDFSDFSVNRVKNPAYKDQIAELTDLFQQASGYSGNDNPNLASARAVLDGSRRLYVHTDFAKDMLEASWFAKNLGIAPIVIVGAAQAWMIAEELAEERIDVVVVGVHRRPLSDDEAIDRPYRLPATLHHAGVRVALGQTSAMEARNLPFLAGTAAAYGVDKETALAMVSLHAAEIAGVGERVGSLSIGKDATLFISSGDALDMRGNQLESAFIRGRQVAIDGMQEELYRRFQQRYASPTSVP